MDNWPYLFRGYYSYRIWLRTASGRWKPRWCDFLFSFCHLGWCFVHIEFLNHVFMIYPPELWSLFFLGMFFFVFLVIGLSLLQILICIMLIALGTLKDAKSVAIWFRKHLPRSIIWTRMPRYGNFCLLLLDKHISWEVLYLKIKKIRE